MRFHRRDTEKLATCATRFDNPLCVSVVNFMERSTTPSPPVNRLRLILLWASALLAFCTADQTSVGGEGQGFTKAEDLVIYQDDKFYSAFPSIIARPDGELICAFRRAPERRALGEGGTSHTDPNSYLVLVRSKDGGKTWSKEPELIYAHPFGGSQDPCLIQLRDGSILCSSYGWSRLEAAAAEKITDSARIGNFVFMGGYILRSEDGGHHWQEPIIPPPVPGETTRVLFNQPCPAYNRGAMCEGDDGKIYWVVAARHPAKPNLTATHLMTSPDQGRTWNYSCPVASDDKMAFNETSLYETPKGDLVAFIRTEQGQDHTVIARSSDSGKSFRPWQDAGFQGHPHYALRLPDNRVLLVYGYRHSPFGVRARVLDSECSDASSAPEIILRDDGGNGDLGYPWATLLPDNRVLVVYYFNKADGPRHIAGTILKLE